MWLAAQELPVRDPDVLWRLLDDGDAELTAAARVCKPASRSLAVAVSSAVCYVTVLISKDELVAGVDRLKGTAKGIDLAAFMMETRAWAAWDLSEPSKPLVALPSACS